VEVTELRPTSQPDRPMRARAGVEPRARWAPALLLESVNLKFEVKYPGQPAHEVERKGPLVTLGRDPTCDLVLNDERCSRRHAVVETTPDGLVVRDAGSANGVFVNGKKIERSALRTGDLLRVGEVILEVLAEESAGTVIVGPDDLMHLGTSPAHPAPPEGPSRLGTDKAPRPPMREPRTGPAPRAQIPLPARGARRRPPGRPFTVTVLASLWAASVILYSVLSLLAMSNFGLRGMSAVSVLSSGIVMSLLSVLMAYGLWTLRPWARLLQAGLAVFGLVLCPFTLASATVLFYVLRPATRAAFGDALAQRGDDDGSSETTFGLTLIGTVLLGGVVCTAAALFVALRT
jgi:FHA domain-containing protein